MPIRGHSGVQGGAEMGCYATAFPGGLPVNADNARSLAEGWGFPVPERPGLTAPEMIDASARGELDVLISSGGNFLEALPDPVEVETALAKIPLRVHLDIVLSSQMLVEPESGAESGAAGTVLLLPAATRYEISGGVTLARIAELATTGADFVSVGALTHSVASSDISFEIAPLPAP